MADEQWILAKKAEILSLEASLEGMKADNTMREHRNEAVAWDGDMFFQVEKELKALSEEIMRAR